MRHWSVLFAVIAAFAVAAFAYAPFDRDWWLPNYSSANGPTVDRLREADAVLGNLASRQSRIVEATEAGNFGDNLAEEEGRIATGLGPVRATFAAVVNQGQLLPATRNASDRAAAAGSGAEEAQSLLTSKSSDALAATQAVARDLEASRSELQAALAGVDHHTLSSGGRQIDHLYILILIITGVVFIGTQVALVWALWKFPAANSPRARYFHGSQRLEVIWTIIPAAILVFIALYQMGAWTSIKFQDARPKVQPIAEVTARQFQWRIRYAGPDDRIGTADDLFAINDLHIVKGRPTVIHLKTEDVLHSFFLPHLRIKQDAVPGLTIPVWFDSDESGTFDIVCAELCGWGHTKMRGQLTVHETTEAFEDWAESALREQNRSQLAAGGGLAATESEGEGGE